MRRVPGAPAASATKNVPVQRIRRLAGGWDTRAGTNAPRLLGARTSIVISTNDRNVRVPVADQDTVVLGEAARVRKPARQARVRRLPRWNRRDTAAVLVTAAAY